MLIEKLTIPTANLNVGTNQVSIINVKTQDLGDPLLGTTHKRYRTNQLRMFNRSGATVQIGLFTTYEYDNYLLDNTISDFVAIPTGENLIIENNLHGAIGVVVVLGAGGGHTADLDIHLFHQ